MTHEQIEYRKYVAQALVWCGNHFTKLSNSQRNAINKLSAKERNQVIHELTMG
ncbi:hypothetical protein [Levilactobacillus brevis]|uniref:hypothetical protein n=1 Tax=Levilactobacillus brevis TaxID=1580 RepID=UPI00116280C0|nr:hypothetical protein [Levilactobacillus brevis]QCZ50331.1 hypothetical protein SAC12_0753 [Levilactobacillus brevis]